MTTFPLLGILCLISVSVFSCSCYGCRCFLFCCWYSGLAVLTVDAICFSIHSTLAALPVGDTGASPCLLWSLSFLPLLPSAPHTLHLFTSLRSSFSTSNSPHFPVHSLFFSASSPLPPPSPSFPHNHLPPPLLLAKVHVINQTKMRLCLHFAAVESYIKVHLLEYSLKGICISLHYFHHMVFDTSAPPLRNTSLSIFI